MVTVSDDLHAAAELLRKRRKYRSFSEYVQGLIRYDGQTQRDHLLTAEWATLDGYERDTLDAGILRQVQSEKGIRGSWIEACISEAIKKHVAETGAVPTIPQVAKRMANELSKPDEGSDKKPE